MTEYKPTAFTMTASKKRAYAGRRPHVASDTKSKVETVRKLYQISMNHDPMVAVKDPSRKRVDR